MSVILVSEEKNEITFVRLILEFKFIAMKNKLKRVIDSDSREEELLHIINILNVYKDRQTLVKNRLSYLYQNINTLKSNGYKPKTELIDLIVILMRKYSKSIEIQTYGTICIGILLRKEDSKIEKLNANSLNQLIEVILISMESFPNNNSLISNALIIINNNYLLENASFDRNKCMKLLIDSMVQFRDIGMNTNAVFLMFNTYQKCYNYAKFEVLVSHL